MKTRLLLLNLFIAIALSGCLKDTQQPVSHVNDVNVSITGTWTQDTATASYYDVAGNKVYTGSNPLVNLDFNGKSTVTETSTATGAVIAVDNYTIATTDTADYINISGNPNHQYEIVSLQSRNLTLGETTVMSEVATLITAGQVINYKSIKTVNTYRKRDLPQN